MLAKNMDYKDIFGEVHNVLFKTFDLDPARCRGFMLDGCSTNIKALMALTTHCANAVGVRCMSHLLNNTGDKVESGQIDKFAGALQTLLAHSHNASHQWRAATGEPPFKAPSHRWASHFERSNRLVMVWEHLKDFLASFTTTDETRSTSAKFCRDELARLGKDGLHQEFWLKLEFALAVDLGVHLTKATYLLEGDGMLVSSHIACCFIFPPPSCPVASFDLVLCQLTPTVTYSLGFPPACSSPLAPATGGV